MLQKAKKVIEQYKKYKPLTATRNICYHLLTRERKKSFGNKNADKTFYLIRSVYDSSPFYICVKPNLLANYFYVLSHIAYAHEKNWIPFIDQLNYPVYTSSLGEINGTRNAWEYFWNQPYKYSLDDVYGSKNVILSKQSWYGEWSMGYDAKNHSNKELISFYHKLSETVPLNEATLSHVESEYNKLMPHSERVLGVSYRFAGYARESHINAKWHPISPNIDELVGLAIDRFKEWSMDKVLLTSDVESAVEKFRTSFGDKLLVLPRKRSDAKVKFSAINVNPMYKKENLYNTTLSYITEMELLSRRTGLIGTVTSGLRYAIVRNNNRYENLEVLDYGRFAE